MFEPHIREKAMRKLTSAEIKQRLLIVNGYSSYIRADFIVYYMKNSIDFLIISFCYSHLLKPLDVGVFAAFKRAYSGEIDALFRLNITRI